MVKRKKENNNKTKTITLNNRVIVLKYSSFYNTVKV